MYDVNYFRQFICFLLNTISSLIGVNHVTRSVIEGQLDIFTKVNGLKWHRFYISVMCVCLFMCVLWAQPVRGTKDDVGLTFNI